MYKNLPLLILTLLPVVALGSTIFKWVDEKGVTHYSETKPTTQEAREIRAQPSSPAAAESGKPPRKSWQEQELEFQQRQIDRQQATKKQEEKEEAARREGQARKQGCILARQNLQALEMQRPVYWINEKGERVFLDDETRAVESRKTKMQIETLCPSQ